MVTDYAQRVTDANVADAAALSQLLGIPVTVDRHGMARINAAALRKTLDSATAEVYRDYFREGLTVEEMGFQPDGLAEQLQAFVEDCVLSGTYGPVRDYATSYLLQVDWAAIAAHLLASETDPDAIPEPMPLVIPD